MKFSTLDHDGIAVLTLEGNILGGAEATQLNDMVHHLIDEGRTRLVIDLGSVALMNSSGIGAIISGMTTLRNVGGDLRIACANEKIQQLLLITKLHSVLHAHASVEDAKRSFL